ncbi:hypothetical protein F4054_12425 [Candidatus Poribacteria bacterium]|nr:hypothetical protein [Candidatus Poribacteria bacterium]MYK23049.1 hypothetical protein [Candidatus Poribacteria bacterium]
MRNRHINRSCLDRKQAGDARNQRAATHATFAARFLTPHAIRKRPTHNPYSARQNKGALAVSCRKGSELQPLQAACSVRKASVSVSPLWVGKSRRTAAKRAFGATLRQRGRHFLAPSICTLRAKTGKILKYRSIGEQKTTRPLSPVSRSIPAPPGTSLATLDEGPPSRTHARRTAHILLRIPYAIYLLVSTAPDARARFNI